MPSEWIQSIWICIVFEFNEIYAVEFPIHVASSMLNMLVER